MKDYDYANGELSKDLEKIIGTLEELNCNNANFLERLKSNFSKARYLEKLELLRLAEELVEKIENIENYQKLFDGYSSHPFDKGWQ